jgi:hypothetical protein
MMMIPEQYRRDNRWGKSLRAVILHVLITLLAVGIAFALPAGAQYILYQWWPKVAEDANLLLATEIGLAAALALLFNVSRIAWENRHKVQIAEMAALVHARDTHNWFTRWRERRLVKRLPAARDAFILTLTGYNTFANADSSLHESLKTAYEIRVMLLNPAAGSARRRVNSLPSEVTLQSFMHEIETSIDYLAGLRMQGKKITLKFYEHEPFWKVAVLGEFVWVQYCHSGFEVKHEPEYVFASNPENPRQGLFVPFYMYFLERWSDPGHPEFDFDKRELVYRDEDGREAKRAKLGEVRDPERPALLTSWNSCFRGSENGRGALQTIN